MTKKSELKLVKFVECLENVGNGGLKSTEIKIKITDILMEFLNNYAKELAMPIDEYAVLVLTNHAHRLENVKDDLSELTFQ